MLLFLTFDSISKIYMVLQLFYSCRLYLHYN
nr:MAG TPA: hypothetical protein [Caudoviricetes sp.]